MSLTFINGTIPNVEVILYTEISNSSRSDSTSESYERMKYSADWQYSTIGSWQSSNKGWDKDSNIHFESTFRGRSTDDGLMGEEFCEKLDGT